ncbi:hypothetical protein SEUCBS139899_005067 [Sporothrix eucalyptigena]|uniref:Uncharacterized protein n=1 Tax=Sporothrix eucalyptigena TaxID=1812306 RepID=A0ABP0BU65_9PEZI
MTTASVSRPLAQSLRKVSPNGIKRKPSPIQEDSPRKYSKKVKKEVKKENIEDNWALVKDPEIGIAHRLKNNDRKGTPANTNTNYTGPDVDEDGCWIDLDRLWNFLNRTGPFAHLRKKRTKSSLYLKNLTASNRRCRTVVREQRAEMEKHPSSSPETADN